MLTKMSSFNQVRIDSTKLILILCYTKILLMEINTIRKNISMVLYPLLSA